MFQREILTALEDWKTWPRRKPLVLRGARQTGKTTVVNMFGRGFDNYIYLNLELAQNRNLFNLALPVQMLVDTIFANSGRPRKPGSTLIFLDEIQNSPKAIETLRYFKEELPSLHVIAAGSLLENVVDMQCSFPVGRVNYMALRPCSFREFVMATGNERLLHFIDNPQLSVAVHEELMALFRTYIVVGGMPEAVQAYASTGDVHAFSDVYETILQGYKDDVEKYARRGKIVDATRFVIDRMWELCGSIVTLGNFANGGYNARIMGEAFRTIGKAMLAELVYPTSSAVVSALPQLTRRPKLLTLDVGLACFATGMRTTAISTVDTLDLWRGRIAEQVVGQELLTLSHDVSAHRDFWSRNNSDAEVDFIYAHNGMLYPIEVKNGTNAHLRSLHAFIDSSPVDVALRVWSGQFSRQQVATTGNRKPFTLINVPLYLVGNLPALLGSLRS